MNHINIKPKFISNTKGRKVAVVLSLKEYNLILERLEMSEDVAIYDERKANLGELSSIEDYEKRRFGTREEVSDRQAKAS